MDVARSTVKVSAAAADVLRGPRRGLVVLIYHRVGRRSTMEVDLPLEMFADQMAWLRATIPIVSLDEGLAWVAAADEPSTGDDGPWADDLRVAVTFDDGTSDIAELALPVLAEYDVPVTVYVATEFVENQVEFPHDGVPITWSALGDCLSTGLVTIGSHTHTHAILDRIPDAEAAFELDRSIGLITDRLGVLPTHFAYPKAVMGSPGADRAVRRRFVSAAQAGGHTNRPGTTDPFRLARMPVQVADGEAWFRRKAFGGMALEESIRQLVNRKRYAGLTH
jgi:peptidoglycan/xylan/chitin deacetylase (PgdA/CDA1 family)